MAMILPRSASRTVGRIGNGANFINRPLYQIEELQATYTKPSVLCGSSRRSMSSGPVGSSIHHNRSAAQSANSACLNPSTGLLPHALKMIRGGNTYSGWLPASVNHGSGARMYTSEAAASELKADDYIQELQDLYEIAKDELEIASESTAAATIYAVSDRITLREALDDLDYTYAVYTGTQPSPSALERRESSENTETETDSTWNGQRRATNFDPERVAEETRDEIKRRVGQRVRELRNAVEVLEESVSES